MWLVLSTFVISTCLISATTYGGTKMEPLYNINRSRTLEPKVFDISTRSSLSLFPVPQDNAIGTNDLNNAITLLSFHKGRLAYDKYFKNAVQDIEGGGEYIPIVSQNIIGFGQTRRFLLYDFRYKICQNYRIVVSLEKNIEKIAIADARQRHFIFEVQAHNAKSQDYRDYTTNLLLMDLSGKDAKLISEERIGNGVTWFVAFDMIFLYDIGKDQLQVLTTSFEPSHHPLVEVIKRNKGKIDFTWIHPHPYLPFAILTGGDKDEVLVSWGQGKDKTPTILFGETATAIQFSFSPDGKWVVFQNRFPEPKKTYLMPVSEKYPHYLGSPILLSNKYFNSNNFGWTTNPISFVGSSLNKLYRWELTNSAHPESDKATFWDFIVEHDLEKLTKEKRQGLGEKHK
ncbi:MAG: hypothetical protein A2075_00785 [Geobacteraceae bacterium GWC2_58_44]|nr:MAG: hypothetical protein A2075_00785 [Geobacteraceae bacterium GWC2_58_44]